MEFHLYQSALILDFLRTILAAGGGAASAAGPGAPASAEASAALPALPPPSSPASAAAAPAAAPSLRSALTISVASVAASAAEMALQMPETPPGSTQEEVEAAIRRWSFGSVSEAFLGGPAASVAAAAARGESSSEVTFWGPRSVPGRTPSWLVRGTDDGCLETSPGTRASRRARRRRERDQERRHREHMREQRELHGKGEVHPPALPMSPKRLGPLTWLSGVAGSLREMHAGAPPPQQQPHGPSPLRPSAGFRQPDSATAAASRAASCGPFSFAGGSSSSSGSYGSAATSDGAESIPPSEPGALWDCIEDPRFGRWVSTLEMAEQASNMGWTPKQRAAMKLLVQQTQSGYYENLGLPRTTDILGELPEILTQVIHYRSLDSLRAIVREVYGEVRAAAAAAGKGGDGQAQQQQHVVVSQG